MSEETKHTPGPWIFADGGRSILDRKTEFDSDGSRVSSTANLIAAVYPVFSAPTFDDCMTANAHLIAAAPDMLAALKALSYQLHCMNWTGELIDNCDAAIAKAEGRAE